MSTTATVLYALLGFNALVVVHELGHFLVARWCGMRVLTFSVGLGPPLLKITGKRTTFQIALLPVGGFVTIAGMSGKVPDDGPGSYLRATRWQRAAMVLAGPFFNLVAALAIYLYLFGTINAVTFPPVGNNVVRDVAGPAAAAGVRPGDVVLAVDGAPVRFRSDVNEAVGGAQPAEGVRAVRLTVARPPAGAAFQYVHEDIGRHEPGLWRALPKVDPAWERLDFEVTPERVGPGRVKIGVLYDLMTLGARDFGAMVRFSLEKVGFYTQLGAKTIGRILTGRETPDFSSVVRITQVGADTLRIGGAGWYLNQLAMLSVSLFLLNLLPFPPLDGGRLLFLAVEGVSRRPLPRRIENAVQGAGIALLLCLMLFVMARDIVHLF